MASTEKKTSLEPSEIFCAVGLLIPTKKMNDLVEYNTGAEVLKWAADAGLKKAKAEIKPLDAKFVKMFQNAGDEKFLTNYKKRNELVANIVAGFSAAIGIKDFMKGFGNTNDIMSAVFMTGAKWPAKVDFLGDGFLDPIFERFGPQNGTPKRSKFGFEGIFERICFNFEKPSKTL